MTAVRVKADKKNKKKQPPFRFSLSQVLCSQVRQTQAPLNQTEKKGVCEWQLFHSRAWNQSAHHEKRDSWDLGINTDERTTMHTVQLRDELQLHLPPRNQKSWVSASVINDPAPEAANSTVYPRVYIFYRSKGQLSKTPAIWPRRDSFVFLMGICWRESN